MRHQVLRRISLGISAGLALVALGYALTLLHDPANVATAPDSGGPDTSSQELFTRQCGGCHTVEELRASSGGGADAAAGLIRFLERHASASLEEDLQITAFLLREPAE